MELRIVEPEKYLCPESCDEVWVTSKHFLRLVEVVVKSYWIPSEVRKYCGGIMSPIIRPRRHFASDPLNIHGKSADLVYQTRAMLRGTAGVVLLRRLRRMEAVFNQTDCSVVLGHGNISGS